MAWDPALLRKYTTTNHFKLLNQIRSELREQPIQRPLITSRSAAGASSAGSSGRRPARSFEGSEGTSRRRTAAAAPPPTNPQPVAELHQPIIAVPVITDLVLPDAHAEG